MRIPLRKKLMLRLRNKTWLSSRKYVCSCKRSSKNRQKLIWIGLDCKACWGAIGHARTWWHLGSRPRTQRRSSCSTSFTTSHMPAKLRTFKTSSLKSGPRAETSTDSCLRSTPKPRKESRK